MERIRTILLKAIYPSLFSLFIMLYADANDGSIRKASVWVGFSRFLFFIFLFAFVFGVFLEVKTYLDNEKKKGN